MINIVGRRIRMQEDNSAAFNIILRDHKGNEIPLTDTDVLTLRMKYSMESNASLRKTAEVTTVDGKLYHIFKFSPSDTRNLPEGDYIYDVILESERKRYTVVPKSVLTLEKPVSFELDDDENTVLFFDTDGIDYYSIISATPLVGTFNAVYCGKTGSIASPETNSNTSSDVFDDEILIF